MDLPPDPSFTSLVRLRWKFILILVLCIIAVYGRSARYDFVTYDDYELVYQNGAYLSNLSNIGNAFATHAFTTHRAESGYYRPLLLLSYIADYQLWQLRPFGYHCTNILLHCCASILLLLLLELLIGNSFTGNSLAALGGALLFALHPIQTESVAWIAGRNDVLLGLFIIFSILMYVLHLRSETKKGKYYWISLTSFALALFTKESAAFYLLLFPLVSRTGMPPKGSTLPARIPPAELRKILPFGIVLTGYMVIRSAVIGSVIGAEKLYGNVPLMNRFTNIPAILSEHLKFILYPAGYSVVHQFDELMWLSEPWLIISWLILAGVLVCVWHSRSAAGSIPIGVLWFVTGLIPVLGLFPLAVPILEHRLYLPLAGLAIIAGGFANQQMNVPARRTPVIVVFSAVIVLCAVISVARLPVWQNSETMWSDAIEKAPAASRSYYNLAGYYFERGEYDKTIDLMNKFVEMRPDDATGYIKLRQTLVLAGRMDEANRIKQHLIELYIQKGDTLKAAELSREGDIRK